MSLVKSRHVVIVPFMFLTACHRYEAVVLLWRHGENKGLYNRQYTLKIIVIEGINVKMGCCIAS